YDFWAAFIFPLIAIFALVGTLSGRFSPVTGHGFRRILLVVNVIFLLWTAASWLEFGGVIPDWEPGRFLLYGAGSLLGVVIHFAWWLIADLLLGIAWLATWLERRAIS